MRDKALRIILVLAALAFPLWVMAEDVTGPTPIGANVTRNPVQMGAYAQPSALPSPVAAGKVDRLTTDGEGNLWARLRGTINVALPSASPVVVVGPLPAGSPVGTLASLPVTPVLTGGAVGAAGDSNGNQYVTLRTGSSTVGVGVNGLFTQGPVAHDSAIAGNPLRIAGRAEDVLYTAVAEGDVADLATTSQGQARVILDTNANAVGASLYRTVALTNVSQQVKSSGGNVYSVILGNPGTVCWAHIYDTANASVTVGTTTPVASYMVPANTTIVIPGPVTHSTAICIAATNSVSDDEMTATNLTATVHYK